MDLTIEKPDPTDAGELTRIAIAAKKHWGYPDEWIGLWKDELTATPKAIESGIYYVGRNAKEAVCFYSVQPISAKSYDLADFWIAPPYIGQGYGRKLFEHLKATLGALGCENLIIVSDPHAEGFYQAMGAVHVREEPSVPKGRMLPVLEYEIRQNTS